MTNNLQDKVFHLLGRNWNLLIDAQRAPYQPQTNTPLYRLCDVLRKLARNVPC